MTFSDDLDRQRAHVMRLVRHASASWAEAMRAHKLAPPDAGFAARLRALAEAAATEQVAWEHAHSAGLMWRPVPGAESAEPPYELRPGPAGGDPRSSGARLTPPLPNSTGRSPARARSISPMRSERCPGRQVNWRTPSSTRTR